jgi:hypothetical protein
MLQAMDFNNNKVMEMIEERGISENKEATYTSIVLPFAKVQVGA